MKTPSAEAARAAALQIDLSAIRRGVYWTAHYIGGVTEEAAKLCGIKPEPHTVPHKVIMNYACESPKALLRAMQSVNPDLKQKHLNHTTHRIARVEVLPDGFIFTTFDTFKEACEAHERDQA